VHFTLVEILQMNQKGNSIEKLSRVISTHYSALTIRQNRKKRLDRLFKRDKHHLL
jgi:hypothetical protein